MANFWPEGIEIPARSPLQILEEAREQWEKESGGVLSLSFDTQMDTAIDCYVCSKEGIKHSRFLFCVEFSKNTPYPVIIGRSPSDRPKKTCQTQGEFREALEIAMNWGETKSAALNVAIAIGAQDEQTAKLGG